MSDPYIGEIRMFGGNFAPVGWAFCQGQQLAISDYEPLFALIGTVYGGDGQTTFALPNLASRFPVHRAVDYPLGAIGGAEQVTLTPSQLPAHSHPAHASSAAASSGSPTGAVWAAVGKAAYTDQPPNATMRPGLLSPAGGNQPHENMPPFQVVNFIISLSGVYPPQN